MLQIPFPNRKGGALTSRYGKGVNSTLDDGAMVIVMPVAMRGREDGAEFEYGADGEPAYAIRTGSGGSSKPMIAYAPDIAATLTAGISRTPGVNPPGRRQEDDYNIVCTTGSVTHTLTAEGADASEDGTGRGTPIVTAFHENSRGELGLTDIAGNLSTGGGKPGQGYPAIMDEYGVRRLTPLECGRLQGYPDGHAAGQSDAQQYRQMDNSVAIPVVEWVSGRLVDADGQS